MTRRHFGQETVDRLVSPLLSGVYGGDASQLSVRAVLPRMVTMEQQHRSLSRAMLAARKTPAPTPATPRTPGAPRSLFTTLRGGMRLMTDGIAAQLQPGSMHLSSQVHSLARPAHDLRRERLHIPQDTGWLVETAFGQEHFDGVILALSAWASASLLRPIRSPRSPKLSPAFLTALPSPSPWDSTGLTSPAFPLASVFSFP
jgi:oxygen-dependent protoporphyrinogen oxidase